MATAAKKVKGEIHIPLGKKTNVPDDFPALAPSMTVKELAAHYGFTRHTIRRWLKKSGVTCVPYDPRIPVPDDFATVAPFHTKAELRVIYGRSEDTIRRWWREAGITPVKPKYRKVNVSEEIALCLTCTFPKCNPSFCPRIRVRNEHSY